MRRWGRGRLIRFPSTASRWTCLSRPRSTRAGGPAIESRVRGTAIATWTEAAAKRCGARTFNDLSLKFRGFTPGFNVFVVGANAFPHNSAYNPTGPVGALAYWTADAIKNRYRKRPGLLV